MSTVTSIPHLTLKPPGKWAALSLRELWHYQDLLWVLASRDVKLRYRQTALGIVWVLLQPLLGAGIFAVVFGMVAKISTEGIPYLVFSYAGLLGWNAFNSTLNKASASIVQNAQLVSKVFFPRLILPLSTVLSTLIDFVVAAAVMVILMVVFGIAPTWRLAFLPIWLMLLLALAVGLGLYTSALMVRYRDMQYAIPVLLQFLFYASPVPYPLSAVPDKLRLLFQLNPLTGLLEAFRWSLLGQGEMSFRCVGFSVVVTALVFIFGAVWFKRMERSFADVI